MDDYFFENHVRSCKEVFEESTSYLVIYNFSVCCGLWDFKSGGCF